MEEIKHCQVCSAPSHQKCSNCNKVNYCSKVHQKLDWKLHKKDCHPFEIQQDAKKGRKLIATKSLSPGYQILVEKPIINLPSLDDNDHIVCVTCCKILDGGDGSICSKCSLPVCGAICEKADNHANYECSVVSQIHLDKKISFLRILGIMRCLLLKEHEPSKYSVLRGLKSNEEKLFEDISFATSVIHARILIREVLGMNNFSPEEITSVFAIICTNALSQMTDVRNIQNMRQSMHLYEKACLANHSCIPNARPIIQNSGLLKLIATRPIFCGDEITITYVRSVGGTLDRQESCGRYHFICDCPRCQDPTELGTYFSSLKCNKCPKGYLSPNASSNKGSSNEQGILTKWAWNCESCSNNLTQDKVVEILIPIQNAVKSIATTTDYRLETVRRFERIIEEYSDSILHPNHYLLFELEQNFMEVLGNMVNLGDMFALPLSRDEFSVLRKKLVVVTNKLLTVADKLFPGPRLIRGRMLFFLATGLRDNDIVNEISKNMFGLQVSPQKPRNTIKNPDSIINYQIAASEARDILSLEPEGTDDEQFVIQLNETLQLLSAV